jgi:hypothetical protein
MSGVASAELPNVMLKFSAPHPNIGSDTNFEHFSKIMFSRFGRKALSNLGHVGTAFVSTNHEPE